VIILLNTLEHLVFVMGLLCDFHVVRTGFFKDYLEKIQASEVNVAK
jgi:hypothetical protein